MGSIEDLPADQRAVLQMVIHRGRSYDEIASVLSIDRSAVRQRALDACFALTPEHIEPGPERALVTDYLLGQLPAQVAEQVFGYLEAAQADRDWARAVSDELVPLALRPLPEVPVGAAHGADGPDPTYDEPAPPAQPAPESSAAEPAAARRHEPEPVEPAAQPTPPRRPREPRPAPGRRRGGRLPALLGGLGALFVAVIVVVFVIGNGSPASKKPPSSTGPGVSNPLTTTTATDTGTTTSTTATTPQILAALNLTSPVGDTQTLGVAQVIREAGVVGIVIDAQGVPANSAHNAYGVWLSNSAADNEFVGFVPNLVTRNGRLATEGKLPANAAHFKHLLITLETQQHPSTPGEVVLSGPFREAS